MPRADVRAHLQHPDLWPEQTHNGCQWLDEKEGEQNVLRNVTRRKRDAGAAAGGHSNSGDCGESCRCAEDRERDG